MRVASQFVPAITLQSAKNLPAKSARTARQYNNARGIRPAFLNEAKVFPGGQRRHQGHEYGE